MTIPAELVNDLRCPATGQSVRLADEELVALLNQAIRAGQVHDRGGRRIDDAVSGALVRADEQIAYRICNGIPAMLADDGISLDQPALRRG